MRSGAVTGCFFASGATSLALEVLWVRQLGVIFGSTTYAISTVVAVFMAGLALGAWWIGRRADGWREPLRAYGRLQLAIGGWTLAVPLLFAALAPAYRVAWGWFGGGFAALTAVRVVGSAAVLLLPTTLMGATLPLLVRHVAREAGAAGAATGRLYAWNTAGAVLGCAGAGGWLIPALGETGTLLLAAVADLALGGIVLGWLARRPVVGDAPAPVAPAAGASSPGWPLAAGAFAAAGAAGLMLEVAWTRLLTMVVGTSVYAFTIILAVFLAAIAAGSAIGTRWVLPRVREPLTGFANCQAYAAFVAVLTAYAFQDLPFAFVHLSSRLAGGTPAHVSDLLAMVALAVLVVAPPMLFAGAGFPLLVRGLVPTGEAVGRRVGGLYAANTLGAIGGSLLAGFWLVPGPGIQATVLLAAACAAAAGLAVAVAGPRAGPFRTHGRLNALAIAGVALLGPWLVRPGYDPGLLASGAYMYGNADEWPTRDAYRADAGSEAVGGRVHQVLAYDEGLTATVAVLRSWQGTFLRVNGKNDASSVGDMATQTLVGHLPMLFALRADRVLVVGMGSGVTVDAVSRHAPSMLTCVELEAAVVDATRFFAGVNGDLPARIARGEIRVVADDARNYLLASPEEWDVIVSEPSNPWQVGSAKVFTREFFAGARRRLAPGGVFGQWLQVYGLDVDGVATVVRTFRDVFPHVSVFVPMPEGDLLLLGSAAPLPLDLARAGERLAREGVRAHAARNQVEAAGGLLSYLVADEEGVTRFCNEHRGPLNTDDNAWLEYHAPWTRRGGGRAQRTAIQDALETAGLGCHARVADAQADPAAALAGAARSAWRRADEPNQRVGIPERLRDLAAGLAHGSLERQDTAEGRFLRGVARRQLDRGDEAAAFADWQAAVALDPGHLDTRLALADYHYELRFFAEALPHARAALAAAPDSIEARVALGRALVRQGEAREGLSVLAAVTAGDASGQHPAAWLFAGLAQLELGDAEAAAATLARYLSFRPDEPRARRDYVDALRRLGRAEEADRHAVWLDGRAEAERLLAGAEWSRARGHTEQDPERFAQAEARLRQSIGRYPFDPEAHKQLFLLLRAQARYDDALASLRVMRDTFPQSRWAANYFAFMAELQVRRGAATAPGPLLAEAAHALDATWPHEAHAFAQDDLRARAADLAAWAEREGS